MKDRYPSLESLPADWLVPPQDQPDYTSIPGVTLDESISLGDALSDAHVHAGHGEIPAIIHHDSGWVITYSDLADLSSRLAGAFGELGVAPGERVAIRGPNSPQFVISAIAAWKIGAVVALVPSLARSAEMEFYLKNTEPSIFIVLDEDVDDTVTANVASIRTVITSKGRAARGQLDLDQLLERDVPRPKIDADLDRVAVVWHTGGTTGQPKGCYHTHRRFLLAGESVARATKCTSGQRWAAAAPIGHALGFIHSTNFTLQHAATLVLIESFPRPESLLEAINRHEITNFTAIAATWGRMLEAIDADPGSAPSTLKRCFAMWQSSSSTEVADGWRKLGVELLNNFGSTAFATWVLVPPLEGEVIPPASLGAPAPGYDVRVVEVDDSDLDIEVGRPGRMAVRGPTGLTYWRLPDKQRNDVRGGWTLQDDLIASKDGLMQYLGRTDFMISTAGHKVAPVEVETALSRHPAVREVAVVGLPDVARQEIVSAFIVPEDPSAAGPELTKQLQRYVKDTLSPYKYPRYVEYVGALPRDDVGKVQPKELRARAIQRREATAGRGAQ